MSLAVECPSVSLDAIRIINSFRDPTQTYLESPWTLWMVNKTDAQNKTWLECIHPIATFSTIQQFWGMYNNLKPPSELPAYWEYALFRGGLGRRVIVPDWDDYENVGGGCMQSTGFNLDPKTIDHLWRDICLKVIEEAWIHTSDYINGVSVSTKSETTRFYVWIAACKEHVWEDVRERVESVFTQDCRTPLKWTPHMERKSERSSKAAAAVQRAAAVAAAAVASSMNTSEPVKRPKVIRSRSVGYRSHTGCTKLEADVKTDEFLAARRRSLLESREHNAITKKLFDRSLKETVGVSLVFRGITASTSYTESFSCPMQRRGRSCRDQHLKGYAEYPVYGQRDRSRCQGEGDIGNSVPQKYCCMHQFCGYSNRTVTFPKQAREMVDVSTQFTTIKASNMASGDAATENVSGGDSYKNKGV